MGHSWSISSWVNYPFKILLDHFWRYHLQNWYVPHCHLLRELAVSCDVDQGVNVDPFDEDVGLEEVGKEHGHWPDVLEVFLQE